MAAACLLVPAQQHIIRCFDENDLDLFTHLQTKRLDSCIDLREHVTRADIDRNGNFIQAPARLLTDIHKLRDEERRQVVNAIETNIFKHLHRGRLTGTGHSCHDH